MVYRLYGQDVNETIFNSYVYIVYYTNICNNISILESLYIMKNEKYKISFKDVDDIPEGYKYDPEYFTEGWEEEGKYY